MSDVAEQADGTVDGSEQETKKTGSKKLIMMIVAAVCIIGGGGAAAWFLGYLDFAGSGASSMEAEPAKPVVFYTLPEITINLSTAGSRTQYLKLEIDLEYENKNHTSIIDANIARILDAFQVYLRELRVSDLEGSAGLFMLKEELRRRINNAIYPASINQVLFRSILIQ
jgi:flagellar FliL protein